MVPDPIKYLRADAGNILQQFMADHGMTLHDLVFVRIEAPRFVENGQGNAGLADIMQGGGHAQPLDVEIGKA